MSFDYPASAPVTDGAGKVTQAWLAVFSRWHAIILSIQQSGPTAERPVSLLWVGRRFFDTTLGHPVYLLSARPDVWVDAMGTPC